MDSKPDAFYIERIQKGDINAFANLVSRYEHMVYSLCIRIVKNKELAEEVAQDVFVKAYTKLSGFKGDSKFSTWLYKIGYHRCLDEVKRTKRFQSTETIGQQDVNFVEMYNAYDMLKDSERSAVVQDALSKLNTEDQTILTLYYFEDLPVKEISKIVNLTDANVKIKLHRSRKKMFSLLKNIIEPKTIELL